MKDLIERQEAIEEIARWIGYIDEDMILRIQIGIKKLPSAQRWIPCSERLPEIDMSYPHHEDYLVQYDSGGMDVASWSNVNRFWTDHVTEPYWNCVQFAKVVAWMPLPEPWKGE